MGFVERRGAEEERKKKNKIKIYVSSGIRTHV